MRVFYIFGEMSVGELKEEHNHQEKYFQFYENKRWLTAQTVPLCVELPKDFHLLLNSKPKKAAMLILQSRVVGLGSLSWGAKMAMKIFVKRVFTIFPINASLLRNTVFGPKRHFFLSPKSA